MVRILVHTKKYVLCFFQPALDYVLLQAQKCCMCIQFIVGCEMFVELVFDQRNVNGLPDAAEIIRAELTKRVHRIFPAAEVRVKPMQANGLNTDASKSDKEKLNRLLEDMFDEADQWLVTDL